MNYMATGLYANLVTGVGLERLERVLDMHTAIPALVESCSLGNNIAVALLLTIMAQYTRVPVQLDRKEYVSIKLIVQPSQMLFSLNYILCRHARLSKWPN